MSFTSAAVGQGNLSPSSDKTLVILKVLNPDGSPYKNAEVKFIDSSMKEFKATTDYKGVLKTLLPNIIFVKILCRGFLKDFFE